MPDQMAEYLVRRAERRFCDNRWVRVPDAAKRGKRVLNREAPAKADELGDLIEDPLVKLLELGGTPVDDRRREAIGHGAGIAAG